MSVDVDSAADNGVDDEDNDTSATHDNGRASGHIESDDANDIHVDDSESDEAAYVSSAEDISSDSDESFFCD